MKVDYGNIVREYRIKKGYTQLDLALQIGYSNAQFISLIERNLAKVPLNVLGQLTVILGIPEDLILTDLLTSFKLEITSEIKNGQNEALSKLKKDSKYSNLTFISENIKGQKNAK